MTCAAFLSAQRGSVIAVALTVLLAAAQPASAQSAETYQLNIPAQDLGSALRALGRASRQQIIFEEDAVRGKRSPLIEGLLSADDALERLLAGSGLRARRGASGVIVIEPDPLRRALSEPTSNGSATGADLEEIVVTGTHIRGQAPVGANVLTITRSDIEASGYATTQQVLQSLPQNFQGGANEDTRLGPESFSNFTNASTVNLRGLGSTSTLLLVNGRRVPVAGDNANFYDVSSIPATAIERVEVLPDGASALYGSDAIAGVINVILREDYDGAEVRLRYGTGTDEDPEEYQGALTFGTHWDSGRTLLSYEYYKRGALGSEQRDYAASADLRPLGGDDQRQPVSNPGNIRDPFTGSPAFGIPEGQDGTSLTPDDLLPGILNLGNPNEGRDLLADQERQSAFASVSQDVGDRITLFAEGRYSERDFEARLGAANATLFVPSSNPFLVDPFGLGFDLVVYSFLDDLGPLQAIGKVDTYNGVLGADFDLGGDWKLQFYGSYSSEKSRQTTPNNLDFEALGAALADADPATAFNPYGDGSHTNPVTLQGITEAVSVTTESDLWSTNVTADGSLFDIAGGAVKLAIGADYREESYARQITRTRETDRRVMSAFAEIAVPLVSASNSRPGLRRLEFSLAGRYEDYSDVGTTSDPKIGAGWSPVDGLNIRGTWGTSFKAPSMRDLDDLVPFTQTFLIELEDPASSTETTFAIMKAGNNGDLQVETATTWSLGFDFSPPAVPWLKASATYFDIDFEDRITSPSNILDVLVEEERFSAIIIRDPDPALVTELCNSEPFTGIGQPPEICTFVPIGAVIDARLNNTAVTEVDGVDLAVDLTIETDSVGKFDISLDGSYILNFDEAFSAAAPMSELAGTVGNVNRFQMRDSVTWSSGNGWALTGTVNFADSYTDNVSVPERRIDSWTTVDLQVSYDTAERFGDWLDHTTVSLSGLNVFDEDPPFVNNRVGVGYDPNNADPLGRFIALQVKKGW